MRYISSTSHRLMLAGSVVTIGGCLLSASPVAAAQPDVSGMTYGDASSELSSAGYTAVVGSVVGDQVPQDECYVVGTTSPTFIDASGAAAEGQIRLNLSCYPEPASEVTSGVSQGDTTPSSKAIKDAVAAQQAESEAGVTSENER